MEPSHTAKCHHGVDVTLRVDTRQEGDAYIIRATQNSCWRCLQELLAADAKRRADDPTLTF